MKLLYFSSPTALLAVSCILASSLGSSHAQSWNGTLDGTAQNWNVNANWTPGTFPNATGANASINADFSANKAISLQQAITVGSLVLGDTVGTSTLTIASGAGSNTLTFDATSGNATLTTSGGANTISAGVALTDTLDLSNTSALTFSGNVSGAGAINKAATTGSITLSGNNTFGGGINLRQATVNMAGAAANTNLGTGTFTFANLDGGAGNTLASNAAVSKTIANNFVQNNADVQTGSEYAQIAITGGSSGHRVLTFTGNFSTGANFYGGNATNANGQSLFLNAQTGSGNAANESTFVFTGDWSGYNGTTGGLATTNNQAFRLQAGSYVFDKSAASASASSGFQLQSSDSTVSTKLIFSEDTSVVVNRIEFGGSGQRHSMGSNAGSNSTVTVSGAVVVTSALGGNAFTQNATARLVLSGQVSGTGAGGLDINRSYTYTSADGVNSTQTPTGIVELSRAAGNTYSGGTTVNAGTLLLSNTSGSATGTGSVSVLNTATLGGSGRIAPTGAAGVSVSSGGSIAPGTTGIGTLTFDLSGTTGTVSMLTGSTFKFDLGIANASISSIAAGSSDMLAITGASASDFAFNGNTVDFLNTGTGNGFYKIFDTSFGATTWTGLTFNGTTGVVSAGLTAINFAGGSTASFIVGTAGNGGDLGDIYLEVVPEPSTWVMVAFGLTLATVLRRRRIA
jgi:hypothetical protein